MRTHHCVELYRGAEWDSINREIGIDNLTIQAYSRLEGLPTQYVVVKCQIILPTCLQRGWNWDVSRRFGRIPTRNLQPLAPAMLNPQSPIPLYRQLADLILAKIRAGEYPQGARIPSEHRLAAQFGIGRPTVRQATDWLLQKGVLARKRGSGTYVQPKPQEIDIFSLAGTLSAFQNRGIAIETRILHPTRLVHVGPEAENPFRGRRAFFLSRLSYVQSEPVLIEDIYLHAELFQGIDHIDMTGRSLSQVVREMYYLQPTGGRQNFRIGYATEGKNGVLGVSPEQPLLLVHRFLHFVPEVNGLYAELTCRTDRFVYSQTIGGIFHE
jgi:GntR family transcriptional regulator